MNNLSFFLLGLVLAYIPACLSIRNKCFSELLKPAYPCCKGNRVIYTDSNGAWGVENGRWCGIDSCFSLLLGYSCCKSCKVVYTDKNGNWGVENGKWCGIKDSCNVPIENEVVETPAQNTTDISNSNAEFDFTFLKMENKKKNMIYSPLSILYALEMLQEGADGNTLAEISKVTGNAKLSKYTSIEKVLSLANGLHIKDSYFNGVKTSYIDTLKEKYEAEVVSDEFKDAKKVNKWIEDKTLGIIKDMLEDKDVADSNSVMLLINALAIDMEWMDQFSEKSTDGRNFYKDNGEKISATTLYKGKSRSKNIAYYLDENITVLTMDLKKYSGTQLEFMAIMPKENLSAYVENITKEQIDHIDKNLILASSEMDGVNVSIPKFKFNYKLSLKADLMKSGVKDAFTKYVADFKKIADTGNPDYDLYVSDALHKADIEFSEEGIKAAAVTVIIMYIPGSAPPKVEYPVNVIINKPFMFMIRDKVTKDIWFTGTVYEPNLWEDDKDAYEPTYVRYN